MTWPELDAYDRATSIVILPTGAIEQHGPHLPLDTDIDNALRLSLRAAGASSRPVLVAPPVVWGMSPHHMAYPGTISLRFETMSAMIRDICGSISHHGFRRLLIVNGHGGNDALLGATVIRLSEELDLFVASVSYWSLIRNELKEIGTSASGGMGHACEMETSLQLHFRPDRVAMDQARADIPAADSFMGIDFRTPGPVAYPLDFRSDSVDGVMGDPTTATPAKGEAIADAAVDQLVKLIDELGARSPVTRSPGRR